MTCQYAQLDGSYVLGALAPAERRQFELHLRSCPACSRSVAELAGLPGLMSRVDAEILDSPPAPTPPPETLWPALLRRVRRAQRRRTVATASLAAAATAAIVLGSLALAGSLGEEAAPPAAAPPAESPTPSVTQPPPATAMRPIDDGSVRATLALESVPWGTRLKLTCTYPATGRWYDDAPAPSYAMVVRTGDGRAETVATWRPLLGKTMQLDGATSNLAADIASVEVRTSDGKPVLRLAM